MANTGFRYYLWHQVLYVFLAMAMNAYSYYLLTIGKSKLTTTDPVGGASLFLIYVPVLFFGFMDWRRIYAIVGGIFLAMIIYAGILKHAFVFFSPSGLAGYSSTISWAIAIMINTYGVTTFLLAMLSLRSDSANDQRNLK